jgi:hypothetical protein
MFDRDCISQSSSPSPLHQVCPYSHTVTTRLPASESPPEYRDCVYLHAHSCARVWILMMIMMEGYRVTVLIITAQPLMECNTIIMFVVLCDANSHILAILVSMCPITTRPDAALRRLI